MARFLFLHGSWHGAWCWHKVLPRIRAAGHEAIAIDLPGRGRSPALPIAVGLNQMVCAAQAALSRGRKTVVVAHSRNGIVASSLAERAPELIERTIYLASFMLPSRKRVLDYIPDKQSYITGNLEVSYLAMWDRLKPEVYRDALYNDCRDDDIELARALLTCEPIRPALTRLRLSEACYGSVPRSYIRLTRDYAVSPELQDRLLGETEVDRVESIDAGHSAYFSEPDILAQTLLKLSGS